MSKSSHLILTIISRGRVLPISDNPIPNHLDAIADLEPACADLHAKSRRAIHFQLRDPANGRAVLVMEHGATTFQTPRGYRHG